MASKRKSVHRQNSKHGQRLSPGKRLMRFEWEEPRRVALDGGCERSKERGFAAVSLLVEPVYFRVLEILCPCSWPSDGSLFVFEFRAGH